MALDRGAALASGERDILPFIYAYARVWENDWTNPAKCLDWNDNEANREIFLKKIEKLLTKKKKHVRMS